MLFFSKRFPYILLTIVAFSVAVAAQDMTREINVRDGGTVEIVNRYGRVGARAEAAIDEKPLVSKLTASSPKGVSNAAIKMSGGHGHIVITVEAADKKKRIDLTLVLPERTYIKVETLAGAVEIAGNFASIDVTTDTGTVAVDVPDDDLKYQFAWTESKPRYLADFDIAEVKEKAAGRFEIKGHKGEKGKSEKGKKSEPGAIATGSSDTGESTQEESEISDSKSQISNPKNQRPKTKDQKSKIKDQR